MEGYTIEVEGQEEKPQVFLSVWTRLSSGIWPLFTSMFIVFLQHRGDAERPGPCLVKQRVHISDTSTATLNLENFKS